jgi:hypothetical protein
MDATDCRQSVALCTLQKSIALEKLNNVEHEDQHIEPWQAKIYDHKAFKHIWHGM